MKRITCLLLMASAMACVRTSYDQCDEMPKVRGNISCAASEAQRFRFSMSEAFSKYRAKQIDSNDAVVELEAIIDGEKLLLSYQNGGSNELSRAEMVTATGKICVQYNENGVPASYYKGPSGFFVTWRENRQPNWYWTVSNEFAVGSWLFFGENGKLEDKIIFEHPTKMTIEK